MPKPRVTISDVARRAGVSKMTVSRVLNNKAEITEATRQNVFMAMEELGYRPNRIARSLATNTTLRIGIMVPSLSNHYFGAIIEGAENFLWENDYHILLGHSGGNPERERAIMETFEDHRVDGVIVLSAQHSADQVSEYLRNQRAAVTINTWVNPGSAARIYTGEIKSMAMAVQHLIKSGRKHLGYVQFGNDTYASDQRYRGFEQAVIDTGLPFDAAKQTRTTPARDLVMIQIIEQLLRDNPQIDGLICFNSGIAARALLACHTLGRRVPDDIAIMGFDDNFLAELTTPPLTTLDLISPKHEVGAMAARLLLARIEDNTQEQEDVILEHKLIIRESAP